MSTSETTTTTTTSGPRPKRVVVPKVWKRPHSTIYGKNVEFGSSLYSDKLGEINGRKFNSELPWTMRNSGNLSSSSGSSSLTQGYLSDYNNNSSYLINDHCDYNLIYRPNYESDQGTNNNNNNNTINRSYTNNNSNQTYDFCGKLINHKQDQFVRLLDSTNPNRLFKTNKHNTNRRSIAGRNNNSIDFYEQYGNLNQEIDHLQANSLLANSPLIKRRSFNDNVEFDYTIGVFVPKLSNLDHAAANYDKNKPFRSFNSITFNGSDINQQPTQTSSSITSPPQHNNTQSQSTKPTYLHKPTDYQLKHHQPYGQFGLNDSPYGQSSDGRKLSLGSINPQSYRPSLPSKTTTAHSSDGEEFEFQDKSSPFYTDR